MAAGEHEQPVNPDGVTAARAGVLPVDDAGRLAGLLGMLADPVRSRILFALSAATELCVGDLALALDVTEDQVSYALKMLRLAGLVAFRKDGRLVCYRLSDGFPHRLLEQRRARKRPDPVTRDRASGHRPPPMPGPHLLWA